MLIIRRLKPPFPLTYFYPQTQKKSYRKVTPEMTAETVRVETSLLGSKERTPLSRSQNQRAARGPVRGRKGLGGPQVSPANDD